MSNLKKSTSVSSMEINLPVSQGETVPTPVESSIDQATAWIRKSVGKTAVKLALGGAVVGGCVGASGCLENQRQAGFQQEFNSAVDKIVSPHELAYFAYKTDDFAKSLMKTEQLALWKTANEEMEFVDEKVVPKIELSPKSIGATKYRIVFPKSGDKKVTKIALKKDRTPRYIANGISEEFAFGLVKGKKTVVFDVNLPRYEGTVNGVTGKLLITKNDDDKKSSDLTFAFVTPDHWTFGTGDTEKGLFVPPQWEHVNSAELSAAIEKLWAAADHNEKVESENQAHVQAQPGQAEVQRLLKSPEFLKKIQSGVVEINFKKSNGLDGMCTASILDANTLLTARHCVEDGQNSVLLNTVKRFSTTGNQHVGYIPVLYNPRTSDYHISYPDPKVDDYYKYLDGGDYAVIVFKNAVFKDVKPLSIQNYPFVTAGTYFSSHRVGYSGYNNEQWKVEGGSVLETTDKKGGFYTAKFNFGSEHGNSGGPLLDHEGKIVAIQTAGNGVIAIGTLVDLEKIDLLKKNAEWYLHQDSK